MLMPKPLSKCSTQRRVPRRRVHSELPKIGERTGKRVLLVDDEEMFATMGKKTLTKVGFQVTAHTDASKALKQFESDPTRFDVVIADRTMPILDGYKLAERLMEIRPNIPVVIASGYDADYDGSTYDAVGIAAYAQKPISISELARILDNVIKKAKAV